MMNDLRPWFRENLTSLIQGLYFQSRPYNHVSRERWIGTLIAWSSILLAVGGNPETFMAPEDIQTLKAEMRK